MGRRAPGGENYQFINLLSYNPLRIKTYLTGAFNNYETKNLKSNKKLKQNKCMDPCGNPFVKTLNRPLDMRRGYAPYIYIYIYEKVKYFFGYAPTYAPR